MQEKNYKQLLWKNFHYNFNIEPQQNTKRQKYQK
jgi:hypothetical protein